MISSELNIEITICSGTLCYIMGGAELWEIEDKISEITDCNITIKASNCLNICQGEFKKKPPCIKINNQVLEAATIDIIISYLENII